MTGWTLLLTVVGAAFLTAQLFRLIDLIERPARRPAGSRRAPLSSACLRFRWSPSAWRDSLPAPLISFVSRRFGRAAAPGRAPSSSCDQED